MAADLVSERLTALVSRFAAHATTGPVRFVASRPDVGWHWFGEGSQRPYLTGRVTLMATTALALQLVDEGDLDLDAPIATYLGQDVVAGLHVFNGVDRGDRLTVRLLLSHSTGLANVMMDRLSPGGAAAIDAMREDRPWSFEDTLESARTRLRPLFLPGTPGRAHYSDVNARLAGAVVERVGGAPYDELVSKRIAAPLDFEGTYVLGPATIDRYDEIDPLLMRDTPVRVPNYMASMQAQGGLVSTAEEQLTFTRAFFGGRLFHARHVERLQSEWRQLEGPLRYGMGLMRYSPSWAASRFASLPEMFGHSGGTGSFSYSVPQLGLFVAGTVNQVTSRALTYSLVSKAVAVIRRTPTDPMSGAIPVPTL